MSNEKKLSKGCMVLICLGIVMFLFLLILSISCITTLNKEAKLRVAIEAKQLDNTSEFDNMWKKIQQVAQVPEQKKNALMEIFNSYAESRSSGQQGGSLALWIKESVPNADMKVYDNLQNIIVASRDRWTQRQKELVDLDRERNQMFETIPSNIYLTVLGRQKDSVKIKIITSSRTEKVFEEGKDDNVDLFKKE